MQSEVQQLPLSHKLLVWFEKNRTQVIWGAVIVVVVGFISWFLIWHRAEKEIAASEALSDVSTSTISNPGARADLTTGYLKVAAAYPKSTAAARALLLAGAAYFTEGKYQEAKTQFERFAREHRDSPLLGQALLGIGACADAQGKTNEAITAYKNLMDHHAGENSVSQAKFALARLYEAVQPTQAKNMYEELNRNEPYGSIGSEAGMRLEELLAKHPELAPKPAPAFNPAAMPTNAIVIPNLSAVSNAVPATNPLPVSSAIATTNAPPLTNR